VDLSKQPDSKIPPGTRQDLPDGIDNAIDGCARWYALAKVQPPKTRADRAPALPRELAA
jgi:hypothetical protein